MRKVTIKKATWNFLFWFVTVMLWELAFHLAVWKGFTARYLYSLPFSLSLAFFFTALTAVFPWKRANAAAAYVILALMGFLYSAQTVYYRIFGALLTMNLVGEGGNAITSFFGVMMDGILHCLHWILLYFLPVPALVLLHKCKLLDDSGDGVWAEAVILAAAVVFFAAGVPWKSTGTVRAALYYDMTATIEDQTEVFGLFTGERLELERLTSDETGLVSDVYDLTAGVASPETPRNIMPELDLEALLSAAQDDTHRELTEYFMSLRGTNKNEYTGLFEGFNVIQICAESFCYYAVDPVRTPTLWKLSHEGIVFDNFYCSFFNTTTNGEYCLNMGILPDFNRMSFNMSVDNYLPFTLGNIFAKQGVNARAYHDYTAYFYGRINSHPNMGYDFKAIDKGLVLPSQGTMYSDLEMFQVTMDEYIHEDRFMAYYMTYSGHRPYSFQSNAAAAKNMDSVSDIMDMPEDITAYLAANVELENALTYMMDRLEEEGIADRTLIILTGDHYPYALSEEHRRMFAGDMPEQDPFWQCRNKFICWSGAVEEPIHVESPCCTQDILPTVLNLLGIEYDSRLLTGTDVLSDSTHVALLQDGSYRTKDLIYDASTGVTTYLTPEEQLPEGYAEELTKAVKNEFSVAASILRSDYYGFAFETLGLGQHEKHELENATFGDTVDKWYRDEVNELARMGVVRGDKLNFNGEDAVTLSEFAVMVTRALELPAAPSGASPFDLLTEEGWQYADMMGLWNAGVLTDSACDPEGTVTLEDGLLYAERLADHFGVDREAFREIMETASRTSGENGGSADPLTRGSAAYFVWSVYAIVNGIS